MVAAVPPTRAEHVALDERPPLAVDDGNEQRRDDQDHDHAAHDPGHGVLPTDHPEHLAVQSSLAFRADPGTAS